jgi:hypothetical protein
VGENIVYLADVRAHRQGWSTHELEHFRSAKNALRGAGLFLETESGLTDEGEPWFVFCDAETGDVLAHFAKIGGKNFATTPPNSGLMAGGIFPDLVARIVACRPLRASTGRSTPAA